VKIIHTSDIHLDSPLSTRLTPAKTRERKRELIATFRRITEDAEKISASAIIISGDLFDSETVCARTLDITLGIIENAKNTEFFYLSGNHEKDVLLRTGLSLPKNLHIFGEEWTYFSIGNVKIIGRSKTEPLMFDTLRLNEEDKNILVLHGTLTEKSDTEGGIGKRELLKLPVDYIALGHYHSYSEAKISNRCRAVYSGTPEGRGFDETGEMGYSVIDISGTSVSYKFVRSAQRTLHIKEVDISGVSREIELEKLVERALYDVPHSDLVRIVLTGKHESSLIRDTETLVKRFESRVYYLEVTDKSKLAISGNDFKNDISLKGEFIRLVLGEGSLSEEQKEKIIECGIRALAGEEPL
jgi:DNA repair exonuclease SbcCD nuclease subunit